MFSHFPPVENTGTFLGAKGNFQEAKGVILGVPLDDTGSFRTGSRFAPAAVRNVSSALEEYSLYAGKDLRELSFYDAGDLLLSPGDTTSSEELIKDSASFLLRQGKTPFFIGGEHTITAAAVEGCLKRHSEIAVLYLDAHADLRPSYMGVDYSHACVAYRLKNMKGVFLYQLGVRSAEKEELRFCDNERFAQFSVLEPLKGFIPQLKELPVYLSIDLDVVDPAFAPGVSVPEPGGISSREILEVLAALREAGVFVTAFDLVEICPPYDPSQITAMLGAKLLAEAVLSFL